MSFDISQIDWANTPQSVKNYIGELQVTIKNLQSELNRYLQFAQGKKNNPADTLCFNGLTEFLVTPYPLDVSSEGFSFEAKFFVQGNRAGEFKIIQLYGPEMVGKTNWLTLEKGKNIGWLSWQYSGIWWGLFGSNGVAKVIHSGNARQGDVNPPMWFMEGKDSIAVNEWHHACGTWDVQELRLYIDGKLVNHAPFRERVKLATQAYIGANYGGMTQFFPGMLDNVRIWNRPLEADEVALHSNGGMVDDEENLVINYSAKMQPVTVGTSDSKENDKWMEWEKMIELDDVMLSPAQQLLINDLKMHLVELQKKRKNV